MMKKTPETKICNSCGHTEDDEKTASPLFRDTPQLNEHFKTLQNFLQTTYEYKRSLKSNLDLLKSFPHSEENKQKCEEQRKYVLDKMNEIESYIIDMVVKMYCNMDK